MKSKRDLDEIISENRELESKFNNARAMAQEIQNQIMHDIPNMLALNQLLMMIVEYAQMLDQKILRHGSTMYAYGCRCEACKEPKRQWAREYEKIKKARKERRGF